VNHKKRSKDMTRKDYEMIARAIKDSIDHNDVLKPIRLNRLLDSLRIGFWMDNPNFDMDKFLSVVKGDVCQ